MKPGVSLLRTGCLPACSAQSYGRVHRLVRAVLRADDLDERKQRRRIEEVHADDALGMLGRLGDLADGDRRGVRGEDRLRRDEPVELGEGLALRLELLDDRLDHEIAVGEIRELGRERQPADRGVALLGRHLPLLDRTAEVVLDRPAGALAELLAHLAAHGLEAGLGRDLRDPRSHRPETDHSDLANLHGGTLPGKKTALSCVLFT